MRLSNQIINTERMPVLFVGHGNPMNAISDNHFTDHLYSLGQKIPKPKAILCISAHWLSSGTWVTHMANPKLSMIFTDFHKNSLILNIQRQVILKSPKSSKVFQNTHKFN